MKRKVLKLCLLLSRDDLLSISNSLIYPLCIINIKQFACTVLTRETTFYWQIKMLLNCYTIVFAVFAWNAVYHLT